MRRDLHHGCEANIVTTPRGSSAPDSCPRAFGDATPKSKNKPTSRHRREVALSVLAKDLEWHDVEQQKRENKPTLSAELLRFFRGRWHSTTGREARPALIRPSRFSHRSHRENRAGQLLSQKKAREATERERKNKPTSATRRDRRKERITIDAMSAAGFFEVSPSCADAASRASASSRRLRPGCDRA
jgi:hypothetical protein